MSDWSWETRHIYLGEVSWCSYLEHDLGGWRVRMREYAQTVVGGFAQQTGDADYDALASRAPSPNFAMRWAAAKCWVLPTVVEAIDCKNDGASACAPFDSGPHLYPYGGGGENVLGYLCGQAQSDLDHARQNGLVQPANLVQVLMAANKNGNIQGTQNDGLAGEALGTYSIVRRINLDEEGAPTAPTAELVSNHEFGHSLGLGHCHAEDQSGVCTVMGSKDTPGGSTCVTNGVCDAGTPRFSSTSAQIVQGKLKAGDALPYHFGNNGTPGVCP